MVRPRELATIRLDLRRVLDLRRKAVRDALGIELNEIAGEDLTIPRADRLPDGGALPVVADETGSPTYTVDLAHGCLALLRGSSGGMYHLANWGAASRLEWATHVPSRLRPSRTVRPSSRREFVRASDPPPWAVLDSGRAASAGVRLRDWRTALDAYLASLAPTAVSSARPDRPTGECNGRRP